MRKAYVPCEQDGGIARQSCILREGHKGNCVYKINPSGPWNTDEDIWQCPSCGHLGDAAGTLGESHICPECGEKDE